MESIDSDDLEFVRAKIEVGMDESRQVLSAPLDMQQIKRMVHECARDRGRSESCGDTPNGKRSSELP